jgi:hypothetical protein
MVMSRNKNARHNHTIIIDNKSLERVEEFKYFGATLTYGCETWCLTLREEQRLRVFENRVLRRIFRPKRDDATGEWRRLHNAELNDLYSSPNIFGVIKSRRMRWAGHVTLLGKTKVHTGFWWGDLREGDHLGDPDVDGRIILRSGMGAWTGLRWLRIETGGGLL